MSEDRDDARSDDREETHRDFEAVLLAVWRRAMVEGCGPEMSLTEAAAVLGASVASVRRRVAAGLIPAYRDARGRIRIVPRLNFNEDGTPAPPTHAQGMVAWLREELSSTRDQLSQVLREKHGLQHEVSTAEQTLDHMKEELGAMWRLLSARTSRASPEVARAARRVTPGSTEVSKIQAQVMAVRKLARRRKWPWALVG